MTENTERGRELYYLIEDVIKYSFEKTERGKLGSKFSKEEFEDRFIDQYSDLSEEVYCKIVEYLHMTVENPSGLVNRSVFIKDC